MQDAPSWEKYSGESSKAFSAFITYRNLSPRERSIAHAVDKMYGEPLPSRIRQWEKWSSAFSWVKRSEDWDIFQDRAYREEQQEAIKNMRDRHIKIAQAITQKALERLKELNAIEMTVTDALQWLESGIKLERLSRGQADITIDKRSLTLMTGPELTTPQLRELLSERLKLLSIEDFSNLERMADEIDDDLEDLDKDEYIEGKYKNL